MRRHRELALRRHAQAFLFDAAQALAQRIGMRTGRERGKPALVSAGLGVSGILVCH